CGRFDGSVADADVFIVQSTCGNPETGLTANDALVELLLMIDAAVGASAARVVAVMPWFAYSRQDKRSAVREPISARLVAHVLETAGADRMITVDLHAGQVQGLLTRPLDHTTAVIVDDIIDSAGTLCAAAQTVLDEGAARVYAVATHGLFSGKAYENLKAVPFEQIVVTDTVPLRPGAPDNVVVLSVAGLLADSI